MVLQARLDEQFLIKARLEAEVQGKHNFEYPEESARSLSKQIIVQRKNFEARKLKLESSTSLFARRVKQRRADVKDLEGQLRAFESNLRLGIKRFEMSKIWALMSTFENN